MCKKILICFVCLFSCINLSASESLLNTEIKKKILIEVTGLQQDLLKADQQIYKLQQDNNIIIAKLENMESWGVAQQEEKESYYEQVLEAENSWAQAKADVDLEKVKTRQFADKYNKIKRIFCILAGCFFTLVYLKFDKLIGPLLASFTGPWSFLVPYISPVLCFSVGYGTAYFIF